MSLMLIKLPLFLLLFLLNLQGLESFTIISLLLFIARKIHQKIEFNASFDNLNFFIQKIAFNFFQVNFSKIVGIRIIVFIIRITTKPKISCMILSFNSFQLFINPKLCSSIFKQCVILENGRCLLQRNVMF